MMTSPEAFEIAVAELAAAGHVTAAVCRTDGTRANAIAWAIASALLELDYQSTQRHLDRYVETSAGDALSELAHDLFDMQRDGATSSRAPVAFARTVSTDGITLAAGTVMRTPKNVRFSLDADVTMLAGATTATGAVTSVVAGADQNVESGTITAFVTTPPQSDLTVTSTAGAAGGNDAETDEQFKRRIRERDSAQPGTLAGIRRGALEVPEVREAAAYEPLDGDGHQMAIVHLAIADQAGGSNPALESAVELELDDWRAAGVYVEVIGASVVWVDITVAVTWRVGSATTGNATAVRDAIVAAVNNLDPSGAELAADAPASSLLTVGLIDSAARSISGVVDVAVLSPVGATAPARGQVLRTSAGRVNVQ